MNRDTWQELAEFTRFKLMVGEPSPHLKIVCRLNRNLSQEERIWRAGCYAVPYSLPTAEVLWSNWNLETVRDNPDNFLYWIREHWKGIHTRTERRCVRTPEKFTRCLVGYAHWATEELPTLLENLPSDPRQRYDKVWESALTVPFLGRYITIRLIECLRQSIGLDCVLYDIRSIGGWSPRKMLAFLHPGRKQEILTQDEIADKVAEETYWRLKEQYGLPNLDYYTYAAMLCEFREAWEDKHQYPGRTHDQELEYYDKYASYWKERGLPLRFLSARLEIFPSQCLGELQGWSGIRHDLSQVLYKHGYNWCDIIYDYQATTDLSNPKKRNANE